MGLEFADQMISPFFADSRKLQSADIHVPSDAHATLSSALAAARAPVTIRLAAGVYREGTLHLLQGVTLIGAGSDTVLESESTVLICDGAELLSNVSVHQVGGTASTAAYGIELRSGSLLVERCQITASCGAKLAAAVLARGANASLRLCDCRIAECGGAGVMVMSKASAEVLQARLGKVPSACLRTAWHLGGLKAQGCYTRPRVPLSPWAAPRTQYLFSLPSPRRTEVSGCRGCGVVALAGTEARLTGCQLRACAEGALVVGGRASAERCVIEACGGTAAVAVKGGGNFEMVEGSGMLLCRTRPPDSQLAQMICWSRLRPTCWDSGAGGGHGRPVRGWRRGRAARARGAWLRQGGRRGARRRCAPRGGVPILRWRRHGSGGNLPLLVHHPFRPPGHSARTN